MAAPEGIVWGSIVTGSTSGRKGKLGIYTSVSNTSTETTVNVQIWFATIYSCTDSSYGLYYNIGTNVTSATTLSSEHPNINHKIDSGSGWSTSNQTKLSDKTYTYSRLAPTTQYKIYAKVNGIDMLSSKDVLANTSFTVPAAEYTVSYNVNGGTGTIASQTKLYGTNLTLSSEKPTRIGYTFLGWAASASATTATYAAGGTYTDNATVTLYAVWEANTYTVKYDANGGTNAPTSQTKIYGKALELSKDVPTRENHNFLGWATSASATTATYATEGKNYTYTDNAAVTLYAVWSLAYVKPRITNVSVYRCDASGKPDDDGTQAIASFTWEVDRDYPHYKITWTDNDNGTGNGDTAQWITLGDKLQNGDSEVNINSVTFNPEHTYTIRIEVKDSVGDNNERYISYVNATLSSSKFAIDVKAGGTGIAFGKAATRDGVLETAWPIKDPNGDVVSIVEYEQSATSRTVTASGSSLVITDAVNGAPMHIQLKSDTVTDFSSTSVSVYGKNLFNKYAAKYSGGCTSELVNDELVITATGTFNYNSANFVIPNGDSLVGKTITISGEWSASASNTGCLRLGWTGKDNVSLMITDLGFTSQSGTPKTITIATKPDGAGELCLWLYGNWKGSAVTGDTVTYRNVQFEIGSSATEYVPYVEPKSATANAKGVITSLKSSSPYMYIVSSNTAVSIELAYSQQSATGRSAASDMWSYVKWSNGLVECWCSYPIIGVPCQASLGGWYRTDQFSIGSFPIPINNPHVVATYETTGYGGLLWTTVSSTTTEAPSYYLIRPTSAASLTGEVKLYVKGTWSADT